MDERGVNDLAHRAWDGLPPGDLPRYRQLRTDIFLEAIAAGRPNKEAVRFQGRSITYGELDAMTNRFANGLLALGARPGDVVGVMVENSLDVFALVYGVSRAGLSVLPMNPKYKPEEVAFQVADAGAKLVVAPGYLDSADVLAKGHERPPDTAVDENAFFHVRFSSGTTGTPKCIATTHRSIALMHQLFAREFGYGEPDVNLITAPIAHAAFHFAAATIVAGGTVVIERGFDPKTIWETIDRNQVTHTFMVPTMIALAMDSPGAGTSFKALLSTASTFPSSIKSRFKERFPWVGIYDSYGFTEGSLATLLRPTDPPEKSASVGLPAFGYAIRVLDFEGNRLPAGEIGEIYVRGPAMSYGYVGSVEMNPGQARDGFVSAGDLGWLDEDGYLYVADRRDDLIVSGGMNVYPAEVEDVVLAFPGVHEVAVVGVPDETWGQLVVAAIVGEVSEADLAEHCRNRLASYKLPRRYLFRTELPKNASAKILRRLVREDAAASVVGPT